MLLGVLQTCSVDAADLTQMQNVAQDFCQGS
jgi:hypothetical protein